MLSRRLAIGLVAVTCFGGLGLLAGCTAKTIPGLSIEVADNPDNRAIVQLLRDYATAFEAKDVERLVSMAADGFYETSGTPETGDDYNRDGLRTHFTDHFQNIDKPTVNITLKDLKVEGNTGWVDYHYVCRFLMKLPSGEQWQVSDELARVEIMRVGDEQSHVWKVVRGW